MNNTVKAVLFWLVILISATLLWQVVKTGGSNSQRAPQISYSRFLSLVDEGKVVAVRISKTRADGTYSDGSFFRVIVPASQEQMLRALSENNAEIWFADTSESETFGWLVNLFAPLALLAALWFFMVRQLKKRTNLQQAPAAASSDTFLQSK
jgi:cell division protease FtsH